MNYMITDYKAIPGEHCGSTAMRNLINHYTKSNFTESDIFGLGAGLDFMYIEHKDFSPGVFINGRGSSMEVNVGAALGIDYREEVEFDNDKAWEMVKEEVLANRPTMLSGDAYYLDYRDFRDHFPSHRFVLLGFDDEKQEATVSDRLEEKFDICSYDALKSSRNPPNNMSTFNRWGKFYSTEITRDFEEAHGSALSLVVSQLQGEESEDTKLLKAFLPEGAILGTGLPGIKMLVQSFPGWREKENWQAILKFTTNAVEKYGSGGGNFRNLYTDYLKTVRRQFPHLVAEQTVALFGKSAEIWRDFANSLSTLNADSSDSEWRKLASKVAEIYELESEAVELMSTDLG